MLTIRSLFRLSEGMDSGRVSMVMVRPWTVKVEVPAPVPFSEDQLHRAYDAEHARRHWEILRRLDEAQVAGVKNVTIDEGKNGQAA